ncbi:MAG: helix-turn-helix domain-containing protein [Draconibacterium sp.]
MSYPQGQIIFAFSKQDTGRRHTPTVGIHYTQVGRYEKKGAQPSAEVLAKMANALGVSSDYLTNGTSDDLAESSLTDKELLNQFKSIEKLPEADKNVVKVFLDVFITKKKLKQLVL